MMVVSARDCEVTVRSNLSRIEGNLEAIRDKLASWMEFKLPEIPSILSQSQYLGPELRAHYCPIVRQVHFKKALEYLCASRGINVPPEYLRVSFASRLENLARAAERGEVSGGEVANWVQISCDHDPELRNYVRMAVDAFPALKSIILRALGGSNVLPNGVPFPPCLVGMKDKDHQKFYGIRQVGRQITAAEAVNMINRVRGEIAIVGRPTNSPLAPPQLALLMWRERGTSVTYLLNLFAMGGEALDSPSKVVSALLSKSTVMIDPNHFVQQLKNVIGPVDAAAAKESRPPPQRRNVVETLARKQHRTCCVATRHSVILTAADVNEAVRFHLAWELDVLTLSQE